MIFCKLFNEYFSAGVGRTGTFLALDIMMQRIKQERRINVFELVRQLRSQRMRMVQTVDQYVFLYELAVELIETRSQLRKLYFLKFEPFYHFFPQKCSTF